MAFRELVVEAVKKSTIMANSIIRRMNVAEWKNISRMTEMDADYISDLASFHMPTFDDLNDDDKKEVVEKIWNKLKSGEKPDEVLDENPEQKPLSQSELKQKIMDYVKQNGAVLYPLESAAENLASALASEETQEESKEEKCSCCGKSPCECGPDCSCGCKKEASEDPIAAKIQHWIEVAMYDGGLSNEERSQLISGCKDLAKKYNISLKDISDKYGINFDDTENETCPDCGKEICVCDKESITEAVMNDIPHEIDDQIHTLKDMRFELEQTKKNWDIAGVETQPMDAVLNDIDGLIASLYQNGAKMANDEISKGPSEEQQTEKEEE